MAHLYGRSGLSHYIQSNNFVWVCNSVKKFQWNTNDILDVFKNGKVSLVPGKLSSGWTTTGVTNNLQEKLMVSFLPDESVVHVYL